MTTATEIKTANFVITYNADRKRGVVILCIVEGEAVVVQLSDYLANPSSYANTVWSTDSMAKAQIAVGRCRRRAADWRANPSYIGIYNTNPA